MRIEWGDFGGVTGGVTGIVGFVVSLVGLKRARQANGIAVGGNALASAANQLASDANSLAARANEKSDESNNIAREANRIAAAANNLASEANRLAQEQDQRETEAHDVRWEGEWTSPGEYRLVRRGDDVALDVIARVTVDGEEAVARRPRVEAGENITLSFPTARTTFLRELGEYRALRQAMNGNGPSLAHPAPLDTARYSLHSIEKWVEWRTSLGSPKSSTEEHRLAALGDFG
ncbi:hypothetical protein [Streptomyces sp. NPDC051014]|uniref:hypothetical protein n=1 Tax=Streptomyces sp. NPDC051014 TaxID=3155751 RepID=UPI0033D9A8A9